MTIRKQAWKTIAKGLLGRTAIQNIGDGIGGQFALATPCRNQIDFSLWVTREAAEKWKGRLDRRGAVVGATRGLIELLVSR